MTEEPRTCGTCKVEWIPENTDLPVYAPNRIYFSAYQPSEEGRTYRVISLQLKDQHQDLIKHIKEYILKEISRLAKERGHPEDNWELSNVIINIYEKI